MLKKTADAIRILSIDAVSRAKSGHPGAPMALADLMAVLYKKHLQFNPTNPTWNNRDRFVLSNGHASMLIYATHHLAGFNISIEDLKNFRQMDSITPGHPEYDLQTGIETTTGPLGQGFATAVGMALAQRTLATQFNRDGLNIIDHHTFCLMGDGCLMEGITHEAASLAGVLKLNKLIVIWDDNGISIDGKLVSWQNEDVCKRFEAYGFNVIKNVDGHNCDEIDQALELAKKSEKPSFIQLKTQIAYGSELANNPKAHGSPLNNEQIIGARKILNWKDEAFEIPNEVYDFFNQKQKGSKQEEDWNNLFEQYQRKNPELAQELLRRLNGDLPNSFNSIFENLIKSEIDLQNQELKDTGSITSIATRSASQKTLESLCQFLPELFGGSADLTPSNLTAHSKSVSVNQNLGGNYCNYGVREFAMCALMNGIYLYSGFIPYGGTFLVFSDYARGAIRLASLMQTKVIYVFTHDSIGVGEDGPTHQPIEHLASLRLIPNLNVWRPFDLIETMVAYKHALNYQGPSLFALSRQTIAAQPHTQNQISDIEKGAYILYEPFMEEKQSLSGLIIATGSEVPLAIEVAKKYNSEGKFIRVVSMPCTSEFLRQSAQYQQKVLPSEIKNRLVIEAGVSAGWERFTGFDGDIISINSFGKSAPANEVFEYFGLTVNSIYQRAKKLFNQSI